MLIAVDAMGGDHGPCEVCPGAIDACKNDSQLELALVGDQDAVAPYLDRADPSIRSRLHLVHAEEVIAMDEMPSKAIRRKRRSSLRVAMEMVRSGEAQGCLSAGNTGAIVAGGVLVVGRMAAIERPCLGLVLPSQRPSLLVDAGATVRCKPANLSQFAVMGSIYMASLLGLQEPTVCLLSNGSEEIKGDDVIAASRELIAADPKVNFAGYIEPNRVPFGDADVVVCEGFTGNIMLKSFEGLADFAKTLVKESLKESLLAKLGIPFFFPAVRKISRRVDYQRYGGSPLLGVDGVVIKAHGRSKATAITSALRVASNFVRQQALEKIRAEIGENV